MQKFNINIKVAEMLALIAKTKSIETNFEILEFNDGIKKILNDCYNKGLLDSFDDKRPRITKTN